MRLTEQVKQAVAAFDDNRMKAALIGGLALAAHHVVRGTRDVDFLVDGEDGDRMHVILLGLGYHCMHRSADAANYVRGDERLDLLYAHRSEARRILAEAREHATPMGTLRVVSAEGLIAFKLQGYVNDSLRLRDLDDIRQLLRANRSSLDMDEVRRYFAIFDRALLLDELLSDHPL